ncbi:MAG: cytochrome d ubiquinol oxidase subunit II [Gammaproteobacteria bacterium]|nr:cytochrome d ubiquinol oxidase subunit II [Gammaproteobacteria bacterium]
MITLPQFWATLIVFALAVYVVLDGFDLGVGILLGLTDNDEQRNLMLRTIEPVWDGNETWLIVVGASLYAAFPIAYSIYLPAFYLGIVVLMLALIFRGIGLEFRHRSKRRYSWWSKTVCYASVAAAFVQGAMMGAIIKGIRVENGQFSGDSLDWVSWFAGIAGVAAVCGYALHGLAWLVIKTEGSTRDWAYSRLPTLLAIWLLLLSGLVSYTLLTEVTIMERWGKPSVLWIVPVIMAVISATLLMGVKQRRDELPFLMTSMLLVLAAVTFFLSIRPFMVPWVITVEKAAAPETSLSFLMFGGIIVMPIILIYTCVVYWVIRGKVQ